ALLNLAPPLATVVRDGAEVVVATADILVGDVVVMKPGGKLPVDGEVVDGASQVDESMLTGESMPVAKGVGDKVIGVTINRSGSFRYRATRVGADTALAQIVKLVQQAQNSKAPAQLQADRAAQWLVIAAILIGLATFAFWFWGAGKPLLFALTLTITVFVIACPDALGLAMPMAMMVGTGLGAKHGVLFKNAAALEKATRLDVVIFDKTGTLTMGRPEVVEIVPAPGHDVDQVLQAAAVLEKFSEHPLALAILQRAGGLAVPVATGFTNIDEQGARADLDGAPTFIGNRRLMAAQGIALEPLGAEAERLQGAGRTVVHVGQRSAVLGLIAIADAPRPSAKEAVARLRQRGVQVAMLTGDNQGTAQRIAAELGIDLVLADVLALEISRATLAKMRQNLVWAVAYNVIAFPLATGVLYPRLLSPQIAALAMSGSTVLVALNALLLKRARIGGSTQR
ncbi:partial putative copper-exporting P-type ATPase V, partial [uncultured bacterium]